MATPKLSALRRADTVLIPACTEINVTRTALTAAIACFLPAVSSMCHAGMDEQLRAAIASSPRIVIANCLGADRQAPELTRFDRIELLRGRLVREFVVKSTAGDEPPPPFIAGRRYLLLLGLDDPDHNATIGPGGGFELIPIRIGGGRLRPVQAEETLDVTLDDVRTELQSGQDMPLR